MFTKYKPIIKRILFVPAILVGSGVVIVAVGGMAVMGGLVVTGYIANAVIDFVVYDIANMTCSIFTTTIIADNISPSEIRVADIEIINNPSTEYIVEVKATQLLRLNPSEFPRSPKSFATLKTSDRSKTNENENNKSINIFTTAIAVNKQQIIPYTQ